MAKVLLSVAMVFVCAARVQQAALPSIGIMMLLALLVELYAVVAQAGVCGILPSSSLIFCPVVGYGLSLWRHGPRC